MNTNVRRYGIAPESLRRNSVPALSKSIFENYADVLRIDPGAVQLERTIITLDYLELPVMVNVRLVSASGVSAHAVAGPTVGVRVHNGATVEVGLAF